MYIILNVQMYIIFQLCTFNVHNISKNIHSSIYLIYTFFFKEYTKFYIFNVQIFFNFVHLRYTIMDIQCAQFFKQCTQFYILNVHNFSILWMQHTKIFRIKYTIMYIQFTQFYKENTQNIFLKYTIFQRK